jgi:ABC-type hemin transport system ATPase subunit
VALLVFALVFAACDNGSTPPAAPSLDSISVIAQPTKTSYTLGEEFSSTGLTVNAVYSDGSNAQIAVGWTLAWNGASLEEGSTAITAETGTKTVAVAYGGKTASFTISVNDSVYTVNGTITTSDGASALGATAQLKQGIASIGSAVSADLNGVYTITGVPAGTYTIEVSLAGYVPGTIAAFAVSNANITGKDMVLQKASDGDTTSPAEVTGLIGTPGDGTVTLTWTDPADDDLDHLEITWTGGGVTTTKSAAADRANSKAVTGLTNGTTYAFTVKAVDASGNRSQGETATATPSGGTNPPEDTTPPAEATGLIGTPGDGTVTLTWTDPADSDLGHLEISWTGGSATAEKSTAGDRSNSKTISGLINGIAYVFTIKAVDASGNESQGGTVSATPGDTTPPAEVTGLIGTPSDGAVTLTWTDPADGDLDHIEISWTGGSVTVEKSTAEDRSNSKTIDDLTNRPAYAFTVKAVDASGNESQGKTISATPGDTMPPAEVTGLTAVAGIGAVTLTWTDPTDGDLDYIEITWTSGNVTVEKSMAADRANSKAVTGLTSGIAYTFTIKAVDASGNESQGETASATPIDIEAGTAFTITSVADWTNALAQITTGGNGTSSNPRVYTLDIQGSVFIGGITSGTSINGSYKIVRLTGSGTLSGSSGSLFRMNNSSQTLIIDGPTLNGRTNNNAALIYVGDGTLELWNGTISGNTFSPSNDLPSYGGGVYVDNGTFTMSGGAISGNTSASSFSHSYGGGVYVGNGTFTMSGGTISGNTSSGSTSRSYGGGVYVFNGTFNMTGGTISDNTSSSPYGGGVYVGSGTFTMSGGTISANTITTTYASSSYGGGVYIGYRSTFTMKEGTINGNTGNGVSVVSSGAFILSGGIVSDNTRNGVYVGSDGTDGNGNFTMLGGTICDNTVGGVSIGSNGSFTMQEGTISDNTGNGVSVASGRTFTMSGGTISGNTGNGVSVASGRTFTMSGGTISGNTAGSGGGVYVNGGTFTKTGGTVYGDSPATTTTPQTSGPDANTATATTNPGTNGHAVLYDNGSYDYYYRNETLTDDASGNISTTDTLPAESGDVLNNWTKR